MKSLTNQDVQQIAHDLQDLVGGRLQKVMGLPKGLALEFFIRGEVRWLWFDMDPAAPCVVDLEAMPPKRHAKQSPVMLFLRSHAVGRHVASIGRQEKWGRVLEIVFGSEDPCRMEIRLFPHGQNILVQYEAKQVCWRRPQTLQEALLELPERRGSECEVRGIRELSAQWKKKSVKGRGSPADKVTSQDVEISRRLKKKKKAQQQLKVRLAETQNHRWRQVGEWLKTYQTLKVPSEWEEFVDRELDLSGNIERCFGKAKTMERKIEGHEERLNLLEEEIARLEQGQIELPSSQKTNHSASLEIKGSSLRLRKKTLDGNMVAYLGRSAQDNLKLLRQAQPWDIWLHLRDYPSSHAIVRRSRRQKVSLHVLQIVGRWLIEETFAARLKEKKGEKFDLVSAECRYVRPLKGDRAGRVTYQNEQVFQIQFAG